MNFIKSFINNLGLWLTIIAGITSIISFLKKKKAIAICLLSITTISLVCTIFTYEDNNQEKNAILENTSPPIQSSVVEKISTPTPVLNKIISPDLIALNQLKYYKKGGDGISYLQDIETLKDNFGNIYSNGLGYHDTVGGDNQVAYRSYMIDGKYNKTKGKLFILEDASDTNGSAVLKIWGDGKVIYTSPEIKAGMKPIAFEADITGISSISYQISVLKSGGYINTFAIADVVLYEDTIQQEKIISKNTPKPTQAITMLYQLKHYKKGGDGISYLQDIGTLKDNFGNIYSNGLGYHDTVGGDNQVAYRSYMIDGKYNKTKGKLFILEDASDTNGSAVLKIWGDGKVIYTSPEIKAGMKPIAFEADITGISSISYQISVLKSSGYINTFAIADVTLYE